ncbi:uncharacterized protein LOC128182128 [Crassostrea angulata]|uniref:uncharacterized protein LOC128182128 n=1 Tax=Magallana angulata TaxID=2784310 RepID=UPI0022B20014|nr:uncharacterized protein LOC128182128 [Crassostrea angulata]
MAAISSIYPLGSPQEHIPICEKHDLIIDLTCEDCDEFICSECAKTDHKDHERKTIPTAGSERRGELKESLFTMKEEGMRKMDEKIQKAANQIENDQNCCDFEVANLQKHHDAVMVSLAEIKRKYTKTLKDNLEEKNAELKERKSYLEIKRKHIADLVKFLEENHNTMTDYSLLEKLTDLNSMMSNKDNNEEELMITLRDTESELYQPNSKSRRLVRHVTLTGDVIREYEYQEDGQTRLFTTPIRVKQNRNTNICVVNRTSETTSELVILSSTGNLKCIYRGQKKTKHYYLHDVVCDYRNNIIVSDYFGSQVYLLNSDGKFLKYLLTENEITRPVSMSLFDANLWISNSHGIVKVFRYESGMHDDLILRFSLVIKILSIVLFTILTPVDSEDPEPIGLN